MLRRTLIASALSFCACAAQQANAPEPKTQVSEKVKVGNIGYFDLAACAPRQLTPPTPVNKEVLVGMLVAQRPQVMECLVDGKGRGTEGETAATIETTVSDAGATHKVGGKNLLPPGQQCIESVLAKLTIPALAKGAAPVTAQAEFHHTASSPGVRLGVNEASDIAGTIRLAEPTWCECYASWDGKPPRTLRAKVDAFKGKPAVVTPEPTDDAAADAVAACLKGKIEALSFAPASEQVTITYPFLFIDSRVTEALATESPDIQFLQMDSLRGQRSADTAIKVGARVNAVTTYDAAVKKYQKNPNSVPVKELKSKCAELVKADDEWIAAIENQSKLDQAAVKLASDLKAKDPKWADAEAAALKMVAATNQDVDVAKKTRVADEAVCPKVKKQ